MSRYIDADTLYVNVKADCNPYGKPTINFDDGCKVLDMIRRTPTADVAPVIHAHWKLNANKNHDICTNCGTFATMLFDDDGERIEWLSDYCPNCGAKMDEEVN